MQSGVGLENAVQPLTQHEEKNGGTSEQRAVCHTIPTTISNPGNGTVPRGPEEIKCASGAGMEEGSQTEQISLWALSRGHTSPAILGDPGARGPFPASTNHLQGDTGT